MAIMENLNCYKTVAASAVDQVLGNANGAKGDVISRIIIIPASTTPGAVSIKDGSGSAITIFTGGTVVDIASFHIEVGAVATSGPWKVSTGANVSAIAIGKFT